METLPKIEYLIKHSDQLSVSGNRLEAAESLRNAVSLLKAIELKSSEVEVLYAQSAVKLAEMLVELDRIPDAVVYFQEATDAYAAAGDSQQAAVITKKVLQTVASLRKRPGEGIFLLVAKYERQLDQLALTADTEVQRSKICHHVAELLKRRGRYKESSTWYLQELEFLATTEVAEDHKFERAIAHFELGTLNVDFLQDPVLALEHLNRAIILYQACIELYPSAGIDIGFAKSKVSEIQKILSDSVR